MIPSLLGRLLRGLRLPRSSRPGRSRQLELEVLESRVALATFRWLAAVSGTWSTPARWDQNAVPGPTDDVILDATGASYTVTLDVNATVASFRLQSPNVTFFAAAKTLTVNGPGVLAQGQVTWRNSTWNGTGTLANQTSFTIEGNSAIAVPFDQAGELLLQGSNAGGSANLTLANGFTNRSNLTLNAINSTWGSSLFVLNGTLVNGPTGRIHVNPGSGGNRLLATDLANDGDVFVNANLGFTRTNGLFTNRSNLTLAASRQLTFGTNAVFTQEAGRLDGAGLFSMDADTFLALGGDVEAQVILRNNQIAFGPDFTDVALFILRSTTTVVGPVPQNTTLWVQGSNVGGDATLTATADLQVDGVVRLESIDSSWASNLSLPSGLAHLGPTGRILVNRGTSGARNLAANITSLGDLQFNANAAFARANVTIANHGQVSLAPGVRLDLTSNITFEQHAGNLSIDPLAQWNQVGGRFSYLDGDVNGNLFLRQSALRLDSNISSYVPGDPQGPAKFFLRGNSTFSGLVPAELFVHIQGSNVGGNATLTSLESLVVHGQVLLETIDSNWTVTLAVHNGPLVITPTGAVVSNVGAGGARFLFAEVLNDGRLEINQSTTINRAAADHRNRSNLTIQASTLTIIQSGDTPTYLDTGTTRLSDTARFTCSGGNVTFEEPASFTGGNLDCSGATFRYNSPIDLRSNITLTHSRLEIGPLGTGEAHFILRGNSFFVGTLFANQTLWIQGSNPGGNANLTLPTDATILGTVLIESTNSTWESRLSGSRTLEIAPTGRLRVNRGTGGGRVVTPTIVNSGLIEVNTSTTVGQNGSALTNRGRINVADSTRLDTASNTTVRQEGGTITITPTGQFNVTNSNLTIAGGDITGTLNTSNSNLTLDPTSQGRVSVKVQGTTTLSGQLNPGQELVAEGNGQFLASVVTLLGEFINLGRLLLTSRNTTWPARVAPAAGGGSLRNGPTGVVDVERGTGGGGREVNVNIINDGTFNIDQNTVLVNNNGLINNRGVFRVAPAVNLALGNVDFALNAGELNIGGAAVLDGGRFDFNGGTITALPPTLRRSRLNLGPQAGTGSLVLQGSNTFSGDVRLGQTLIVQGSNVAGNSVLTALGSFTNAGTIILESINSNWEASLSLPEGVLTNVASGVLQVNAGTGGARNLLADIVNNGTVNLDTSVLLGKTNGVLTNNRDFRVGAAASVVFGNAVTFQQNAGALNLAGRFTMDGDTFQYNGGTLEGVPVLRRSSLNLATQSPASFLLHGASRLGGDVAAGQSLWIQGNNTTGDATLTAPGDLANGGDLRLESIDSTWASNLVVAGTLTNLATGTVRLQSGTGGGRTLTTQVLNQGTMTITTTATVGRAGSNHVNAGTWNQAGGTTTLQGTTFTNTAPGIFQGTGTLNATQTGFANDGLLRPGGASPGQLNLTGNFRQSPTGSLEIDLGGPTVGSQHDRLAISGAAALEGTLRAQLVNGYLPNEADNFLVMSYASHTGTFFTVAAPQVDGDQFYLALDLANGFFLRHPLGRIVTATDAGVPGLVQVRDAVTDTHLFTLQPFPGFLGGLRVTTGDVSGDRIPDILVAAGPGGGPHVKVFDGATGAELRSFFAFTPSFRGGLFVAAGDQNADALADIVVGADAGAGAHVQVFSGRDLMPLRSFLAYPPGFLGGVRVAAGDVTGDGVADILTGAGPGGGPHAKVFDGATGAELQSFFAFAPTFRGGIYVALGDTRGRGRADLVIGAGAGAGPHVTVFDGATLAAVSSFFAYDPRYTGGVRVGTYDVNFDGHLDVLTGPGPGAAPLFLARNATALDVLDSFVAFHPQYQGGLFVAGGR